MKLYERDYLKSPFLEEELEYEEVQKKNMKDGNVLKGTFDTYIPLQYVII